MNFAGHLPILFFACTIFFRIDMALANNEPIQPCQVPPLKAWSEPEQWAWLQVCEGKIADFNDRYSKLDPTTDKGWTDHRKLSPVFLATILLLEPFKSAHTFRGIRIQGAWFKDAINLEDATIDHALRLEYSRFEEPVKLQRITIALPLSLTGSTFVKKLDMAGMEAHRGVWMDGGAQFSHVNLLETKIGGDLSMIDATFTEPLNMLSLQVDQSLLMSGGSFSKNVALNFARVSINLVLSEASFETLDLTGTKIGGALHLGSDREPSARWKGAQQLNLQYTKARVIEDREESWPETLELEGFTYDLLGHLVTSGKSNDIEGRPTNWFINWLAKDTSYTPQPYKQLADVLRQAGEDHKANEILFTSRERARGELRINDHWGKWAWETTQWAIIGYGYRLQLGFYWLLGLVLLGAFVLRTTGQGQKHRMPYGLSYSLDMLLPIIRLRKMHYDGVDLSGFARYYFYAHILLGYTLASFLIAGLSGLVK